MHRISFAIRKTEPPVYGKSCGGIDILPSLIDRVCEIPVIQQIVVVPYPYNRPELLLRAGKSALHGVLVCALPGGARQANAGDLLPVAVGVSYVN